MYVRYNFSNAVETETRSRAHSSFDIFACNYQYLGCAGRNRNETSSSWTAAKDADHPRKADHSYSHARALIFIHMRLGF